MSCCDEDSWVRFLRFMFRCALALRAHSAVNRLHIAKQEAIALRHGTGRGGW